jgi:hypothetical protein
VTAGMPPEPVGEAVLAARRKLEGISSDVTAKFSESSQRAIDAGKKAAQAHQDFSERVKKIEGRVREMAANRAAEQAKRGPEEIRVAEDDREDSSGLPEEYRDIAANYSVPEPAAAAHQPGLERQPEPTAPVWQRGRAADDWMPADALTPPAEDDEPSPQEADRWQVQAGRFGRRKQSETPKPATRKPSATTTERARPVSDDDYFDNDSWLR